MGNTQNEYIVVLVSVYSYVVVASVWSLGDFG